MSSGNWQPFCLGLNVLKLRYQPMMSNCQLEYKVKNKYKLKFKYFQQIHWSLALITSQTDG